LILGFGTFSTRISPGLYMTAAFTVDSPVE
jgi:hypothetical protein